MFGWVNWNRGRVGALAFIAVVVTGCIEAGPHDPENDRIDDERPGIVAFVAHGGYFTSEGVPVTPSPARIEQTQRYYIDRLSGATEAREIAVDAIYDAISDVTVANALYLDELLLAVAPSDRARIQQVNDALRYFHLHDVRGEDLPKIGDVWYRGVPVDAVATLQAAGISVARWIGHGGPVETEGSSPQPSSGIALPMTISTAGEAYRRQCRDNGVPVPDYVLGRRPWVNRGEIENEFLSSSRESELWSYKSTEPPGVCLALPRWKGSGVAEFLGVICLGTHSSKACFFDNPNGTSFPRGAAIPIEKFLGGTDLTMNSQGECTDCHAGENPFVIHPEEAPFASLLASDTEHLPLQWHDPLVDASWRQNPGPLQGLGPVSPGQQECTSCHVADYAGRLPLVSELKAYCSTVLANAVDPSGGTMPPFGMDSGQFDEHAAWLAQACGKPGDGSLVPPPIEDDREHVGPPRVVSPLYACATTVGVKELQLHAKLDLLILDSSGITKFTATRIVEDPYLEEFTVSPLNEGDRVYAFQTVGGVTSEGSPLVEVRNHEDDYPKGLPAPAIVRPVHECATRVGAYHVPGAELTVWRNDANPQSAGGGSTGLTPVWADGPFAVGDELTLRQSLCGDDSPLSHPAFAAEEPARIPKAETVPNQLYAGQAIVSIGTLVRGATFAVSESDQGLLGTVPSWPLSWYPFNVETALGRPLEEGDVLELEQHLCGRPIPSQTAPALPCSELPTPLIAPPHDGDESVIVADDLVGATIRVWDPSLEEIGEGKGGVISLSRPVSEGEIVTVTREVSGCVANRAYAIEVLP